MACFFYGLLFFLKHPSSKQEITRAAANKAAMTRLLTRRELAQQALAGTAGALLSLALPARAQVVDPLPTAPPPLPLSPKPKQNALPMPTQSTQTPDTTTEKSTADKPTTEGTLLTQLVPVAAGYTLSETQTKEVTGQLENYPGSFAKARAYAIPDDISPAFAATAPTRKERVK